jgi:flagellar biosynthesis protein FlhB
MERPFPPTKRRVERALSEGDVPLSRFAVRTAVFAAALLLVPGAVRALAARFDELLTTAVRQPSTTRLDVLFEARTLALPLLAALAGVTAAATLLQTGARRGGRHLRPDEVAIVKLLRAGLLAGLLVLAVTVFVRASGRDLRDAMDPKATLVVTGTIAERAFWLLGIALGLVAAADIVLTRAAWLSGLRMSRQERLEEQRASEAPVAVRRARRRAFEEIAAPARDDAIPR